MYAACKNFFAVSYVSLLIEGVFQIQYVRVREIDIEPVKAEEEAWKTARMIIADIISFTTK